MYQFIHFRLLRFALFLLLLVGCRTSSQPPVPITKTAYDTNNTDTNLRTNGSYPLHQNITATLFWIGEDAASDNHFITNHTSAWDDRWLSHYGGVDSPLRNTILPADFTPLENPFYFALPYNDFDGLGERKKEVFTVIPWAKTRVWEHNESMLKNRWIKIIDGNKTAYAQWEDSGPFVYDDSAYVFGTERPHNDINHHAGLDLSPAVWIYLGYHTSSLDTEAILSWQFIDAADVPDGPWKQIITTRQIDWY